MLITADDQDENYPLLEKTCLDDFDVANDALFSLEVKIDSFQLALEEEKTQNALVQNPGADLNASFRINNNDNAPKLEDIKVPSFDGEILNFPSFKGLFENLVHNTNMPGVRKLHHLKKSFRRKQS